MNKKEITHLFYHTAKINANLDCKHFALIIQTIIVSMYLPCASR